MQKKIIQGFIVSGMMMIVNMRSSTKIKMQTSVLIKVHNINF